MTRLGTLHKQSPTDEVLEHQRLRVFRYFELFHQDQDRKKLDKRAFVPEGPHIEVGTASGPYVIVYNVKIMQTVRKVYEGQRNELRAGANPVFVSLERKDLVEFFQRLEQARAFTTNERKEMLKPLGRRTTRSLQEVVGKPQAKTIEHPMRLRDSNRASRLNKQDEKADSAFTSKVFSIPDPEDNDALGKELPGLF